VTAHLKRTVVEVRGLHWATSKAIVEHVLLQRPGVASVGEDPVAQTATVSFDPSVTSVEQIPGWVRDCGYHCRVRIGPRPRLLPGGRNRAHFRDGARAAWIFFDCAYRALKARTLHISPQAVISASEVLSPHTALELEDAWGSAPFDVYAATETAGIASPCIYRNRHVYEDLLIIEPVDRAGNPVPEGTTGAKLLVTVLFSRTLPLIRYEMSDTVRLAGRGCPCGRAFTRLADIEGRTEDVLHLPGKEGWISIHPIVFHHLLDQVGVAGWQVIQEPFGLRVLLAGISPHASTEGIRAAVRQALTAAGVVQTGVDVQLVDHVERTALGKAPFVRGLPGRV